MANTNLTNSIQLLVLGIATLSGITGSAGIATAGIAIYLAIQHTKDTNG